MNVDDNLYSYKVNKKFMEQVDSMYNYQCEDCNDVYMTNVPWDVKCPHCMDNYYKGQDDL